MRKCLNGEFGTQVYELDLIQLYPQRDDLDAFLRRWSEFAASDPSLADVCFLEGDKLRYFTESFVSPQVDARPPLLILLGNPAPHSVASGICFAHEGKGKEHRF